MDWLDISVLIMLYFGITASILLDLSHGLAFCNPIYIHKKYTKLNIVGVCIVTFIYNVLWLPYAIEYWFYKLITWKRKK